MKKEEIFRAAAAFIAGGVFDDLKKTEQRIFMPNVRGLAVELAMKLWNDVENHPEMKKVKIPGGNIQVSSGGDVTLSMNGKTHLFTNSDKLIVTDPDGDDGDLEIHRV